MMTFMQFYNATHGGTINEYRELFKKAHGSYPAPPLIQDFVFCHEDADVAEAMAEQYIGQYFLSVIKHYDFAGEHWRATNGYETYQVGADMIREAGMENAAKGYVQANIHGTPEQCIEQYAERRRSEEHTSELQSLMRISYAVFCLKKKKTITHTA